MIKLARLLAVALLSIATPALADINVTPGSGAVIFDFTCFTTKHCAAVAITDSAGTEVTGAAGSPSTKALTIQGIGSGTPIPISGTVTASGTVAATQSGAWNITNISGTVSLPTGAATAVKQPALGTAGTASADVISVQGIASMTPLLATLSGTNNINNISGTISLPTLAATSTKQSDGTQKSQIVDGSGNVIASTSNALNVNVNNTNSNVANNADGVAAGASAGSPVVNYGYVWNGATWDRAPGTTAGVTVRSPTAANFLVTLPAETTKVLGTVRTLGNVGAAFDAAMGAAPPANALYLGALTSGATGGLLGPVVSCDQSAFLNMTTATTTEIVALTSGRQIMVCSYSVSSNGTTAVKFVRGTGSNCGTGTADVTANDEWTAQTGIARGNGLGTLFRVTSANALCVVNGAGVNAHINVTYGVI